MKNKRITMEDLFGAMKNKKNYVFSDLRPGDIFRGFSTIKERYIRKNSESSGLYLEVNSKR